MYTVNENVERVKKTTWKEWFHTAVKNNDLNALNTLYMLGGNILEEKDLITIACKEGYLNIVEFLLDKGVDISHNGGLALMYACKNGYLKIVELLCEAGANIEYHEGGPLRAAVSSGHLDIVQFLINLGADVTTRDNTPMHIAVHKNHTEIAKILLQAGAKVEKKDKLLSDACKSGNLEMVRLLIGEGVDVNYNAPIIFACRQGNINIVRALIEAGANGTIRHNMPIQVASSAGNIHIIEELMKRGADPLDNSYKAIKNAIGREEDDVFKFYAKMYKKDFLKKLIKDYLMTDENDRSYCRFIAIIDKYGLD